MVISLDRPGPRHQALSIPPENALKAKRFAARGRGDISALIETRSTWYAGCDRGRYSVMEKSNNAPEVELPANPASEDDVYELPAMGASDAEIPAQWRSMATYTLETLARCPHCREPIRSVRVIGLSRAQVSFTSTLPRKGRVITCPECDCILSAELTGLV